ncbi:unnamed protein product [Urochloa decumbens]|uniref:NB-ARC domain-containing protein n=1 Tax=Urochloa decumbens TaxID=240449 RepID=A0ABC9DZ18_9POAL
MNKSSKFLAEELEEMEKFLAYVDREEAAELVAQSSLDADDTAFFKKIRDMACDIKDCLIDMAPHRERPPLWRLPWASLALRHSIATALEELVSQVNALNQRRERYQCARDRAARKQKSAAEKEARPIVPEIEWKEDLGRLIARPDESLAVISVWLMKGLGSRRAISLVGEVYDDAKEFQCRAWVTATHPISLTKFLKALARQFLANDPATSREALSALADTETLGPEQLMGVVARHLGQRRYLVVVEDVCSRPEWDWMKLIFPDDRKGSRIIVTSRRADVASHCVKRTTRSFKLEGAPDDEAMLYVSSDKVSALKPSPVLCFCLFRAITLPGPANEKNLLAINIISGLLGTKTRTATEWKKLLERFDSELMKSPNHGVASAAAKLSYHDLPSPMKFLVQYLSIFPRGYNITLSRVARASLAETYRRNARGDNAEEAEDIFDALVTRSMVHPLKRAEITSGRINGCHVNDVFRQLWFSEAKSGSFIYILDEETVNNNLSVSQIRHLVVTGGWTRDGDQFKKLDLSCARSLTVLGKWNSCFISPSMRSLRVLDLENTEDLVEHHDLEHIGEFRHLKYLGLRNTGIAHLPKSLGKLQGLEELDIRGTYITKLPSTVIRLTRLRRLHGGTVDACYSQLGCPGHLKNVLSSAFCICLLPLCQRHRPSSVRVPEKIGELKSLLTMGTIDAAGSRTVMKEVQKLTQLQKLGVVGVTKRNSKHLCSTLDHLHHLRSLLVHSDGSLSRLDTVTSPSHHLETLKLHGKLGTLPRWIKTLHSLVKLCLSTTLLDADAVQIMAELPKLIVLRLLAKSLVVGEMAFQRDAFPKLELLQLDRLENLMSFSFQRGALPNLEVLQVYNCMFLSEDCLRLYHDLPRIKKVFLDGMLVQKQPGHQERLRKWRKQTDKALQGSTMDLMIEDKKEEIRRKIRAQAHVIRSAFRFKEAGQKYQIRQ